MTPYPVNLSALYRPIHFWPYDVRALTDEEEHLVVEHVDDILNHPKEKPTQKEWDNRWSQESSPQYYTKGFTLPDGSFVFRFQGRYIKSHNNLAVYIQHELLRRVSQAVGKNPIIEFGCGAGQNLRYFRGYGHEVYGTDYAQSSLDRLKSDGIDGEYFDMMHPKWTFNKDGVYLTVGSLEQLDDASKMYDFFQRGDELKIHIEPVIEKYNFSVFDLRAKEYHLNRKYNTGYFAALRRDQCPLEIMIPFGTLYDEGFNIVVWQ